MNRHEQIELAKSTTYDICIIGGGITAAGILYYAQKLGYKTILLERQDFAFGTSSRSSKMIHGGLRYLKNLQIGLVWEALHEREHLLQLFPHLVKPIQYILPSYNSKLNWYKNRIGITLYDYLAGKTTLPKHRSLSAKEVTSFLPNFKLQNLKGGVAYWDAKTNDAKLVLDVITNCNIQGANTINYCGVNSINKNGNSITSINCEDKIEQETFEVKANIYISATGVWTDELLQYSNLEKLSIMKPSKGVHVIVSSNKMPKETVAIIESDKNDGRFLYNLPWENNLTILGTTDTNYNANPNEVNAQKEDVDYILSAFNKSFPKANFTYKDIVAVYFGLRPMLTDNSNNSYQQSRDYKIWWNTDNMLIIAGGKLTSFLSMGKHCIETIHKKLPLKNINNFTQKNEYNTSKWSAIYGNLGTLIDRITKENPQTNALFTPLFQYTKAEILFFIHYQFAQTLDDMLTRRTHITYSMQTYNAELVIQFANFMANELNKNDMWIEQQITNYKACWQQHHPTFL